jgi:hypothetical protein
MPDQSRDPGAFQYAAHDLSANALRKQLLQGQAGAAALGAMSEALELYSFLSTLPDALVASQKREATRLEKSSREKGPRIEALKVSIDQAAQLSATARWGQARVDRALAAVIEPNDVFHGFISGTGLQLQKGYTVRLVDADGKPRHSAVTEADGYFTMTLKSKEKASPFSAKDETQMALLGEMLQLLGMRNPFASAPLKTPASPLNKEAASKEAPDRVTELASVEILDPSGQRVQQDPVPVDLNSGTVYREYAVESKRDESATKRYVGNSASRELHDTEKLTKQCNFDAIRASHKVYFDSTAAAEKAGYDYCAYCFDRKMSKR